LLVPQEVGAAAISSVLLGWVLAIAVGCDLADGAADRLGRHLHAYRHARGLELSRAAGGIAKGLKRAPVVFATWRGSGRSRALVLLLLITTLLAVGQYVVIAFAGALLMRLTDATLGKIAAVFALFRLMTLVGNLCASRVVQRWGAFTTSAFFMACVVLGAGLWAFGAGIYPSMAAGAVIWGFGFAAVTAMQQ
jgi:predicted MFS family arabinose efflux permease